MFTPDIVIKTDKRIRLKMANGKRTYRLATVIALLLCLSCAIVGCRSGSLSGLDSGDGDSPVIVEINGTPENRSDFERFVKSRLSDFAASSAQTQAERDQQKSSLLDKFIERQLIVREAIRNKIEPTDEELRRALEAQHTQTSTAGTEADDKTLSTLESSERRLEIFNDLLMLKYQSEVIRDLKVSPQQIEEYYSSHRDKYQGRNGFYVREIRVHDETEAQKLHRQALAKPDDFAVLAKQHSEGAMATSGGLIYYEPQQLPPTLEQAISPLKVGSISRVVKSNFGFHIFKLEQRAEPLPIEKVRKEIEDKLISEKNQSMFDEFKKSRMESAQIKIYRDRLGFNYIGSLASP